MKQGTRSAKNLGIQIAEELRQRLTNILGAEIQVTLFGSYARDEATDDSDIDVLTMLPDLEKNTLDIVFDIAWEIGFEAGKVIAVVPATHDEMSLLSISPFFQAVLKEGISA